MLLSLQALLFFAFPAQSAIAQSNIEVDETQPQVAVWTAREVQHVYGLPEAKSKEKGSLTLSETALSFTGTPSHVVIPRRSIIAVSTGNQSVELWGMKGRVLRMVIPDGGGLAAAAFMHHQVNMLTVEFSDGRGGYHGAVFYLPADDAQRALESFSQMPAVPRELDTDACHDSFVYPHSVLVMAPSWDKAEVPAAYRALVYEHLLDRLKQVKGVDRVYRDGEAHKNDGCPQYTMQISVSGFRQGSQVKRAVMGPAGFFVGTTQITFDTTITDASGRVNERAQVKATVRGESESMTVATSVAKKLTKHYSAVLKKAGAPEFVRLQ